MNIIPIEPSEPSDITMSSMGYATYYDRYFDTQLPKGLTASVVTGATSSKLTYQVIADGNKGEVVPADVAVVLKSNDRSADSYTLTPKEATATYTGPNLLHGSDEATTTFADTDNCLFYKLSFGPSGTELSDTFGWFWGEDDGKPFLIEGHKAWLAIPKSASVKPRKLFYTIEGEGISLEYTDEENMTEEEEEYYDLQGRRVDHPTQCGIYIRNGKKIYVK